MAMGFYAEWSDGGLTRLRARTEEEAYIEAAEEGYDRELDYEGVTELDPAELPLKSRTCNFCPARGTDVVLTVMGPYRPLPLCPPCRGVEPDVLTEESIARRYERSVRLHGGLPELVDLNDPCP